MAPSGLQQARQLRRDALRKAILDAAWELTSSRGLHGLSLRALSGMLRIDHQRIYTHFGSKREIYRMLFANGFPASQADWTAVGVDVENAAHEARSGSPRRDDPPSIAGDTGRPSPLWSRPPVSAVDAIEMCSAEAARVGHVLGGFARRCNSATYGFAARCRLCGREMEVCRTPAGWTCATDVALCGDDRRRSVPARP